MVKIKNRGANRDDSFLDPVLVTDVVHKLKNGLGGIAGFTGLLERDIPPDDPKYKLVQRIYNGVLSVNETVVALMNLSIPHKKSTEDIYLTALVKEIWANELYGNNGSTDKNDKTVILGEKFKIKGDKFIIQKLITSAFNLIKLTGNVLLKIEVFPYGEKAVIKNTFKKKESESNFNFNDTKSFDELLRTCEPIEARLHCAVMNRMIAMHGGKVVIQNLKASHRLIIELNRG